MLIAQNWLGSTFERVFESRVGLDRGCKADLLATTFLARSSHAIFHSISLSFVLQALLLLLKRQLDLRFLLGSLVRDRFISISAEVEGSLYARQILEDELLRDGLVDLAVRKADHLQLVHVSVDLRAIVRISVDLRRKVLCRSESLILTRHIRDVQTEGVGLDLEAQGQFQVLNVTHEELIDGASHKHSELHRDFLLLLWWDHASFWLEASNGSVLIINILPVKVDWQIAIVDELEAL